MKWFLQAKPLAVHPHGMENYGLKQVSFGKAS